MVFLRSSGFSSRRMTEDLATACAEAVGPILESVVNVISRYLDDVRPMGLFQGRMRWLVGLGHPYVVQPGNVRLLLSLDPADDQRRRGIDSIHDEDAKRDRPTFGVVLN